MPQNTINLCDAKMDEVVQTMGEYCCIQSKNDSDLTNKEKYENKLID